MLTVSEEFPGGENGPECMMDVEEAVAELVKDAGPTILRHLEDWSSVKLPDGAIQELEELFGEV
jgi:hypothetical protein